MNSNTSNSTSWALILIALAVIGAGISYHFTLESKFAAIQQKLDQNSTALQQYQASQESVVTAKTEALNKLAKEVDTLQASMEPLGKSTHEQNDTLSAIRKQISTLQESQQSQVDAQKKLADYADQLDKIRRDVQAQAQAQAKAQAAAAQAPAVTPAPAPVVTTPAPAPTTHASVTVTPSLPVAPRTENAVDIRPAEITVTDRSNRATPVALPVTLSVSDAR